MIPSTPLLLPITGWHVLGLLHRHSRSHPEAAKAYLNALRFDPSNLQIVRDLTSLQIQLRDFDGFNESQHKLLEMRPGVRMHWLGLAVSYHLLGDFAQAVKVLEAWNKTNRESRTGALTHDNKMEDQEIELYRCFVLEESGDLEGAVRDLEKFAGEGGILDRVTYESARGGFCSGVLICCPTRLTPIDSSDLHEAWKQIQSERGDPCDA